MDLLKDHLEEAEEQTALVVKELREKSRDFELLKRQHADAQRAVQLLQVQPPFLFSSLCCLIACWDSVFSDYSVFISLSAR